MALVALSVLNFIWNHFISLYCDSCLISACISKKKLSKLVNFYVAILVLKTEENTQHVQHIMVYYFKKGKMQLKLKKKISAVYGEGSVIDWTCQKWFAKFCAGDFSLDDASGRIDQLKLISNQIEILISAVYKLMSLQYFVIAAWTKTLSCKLSPNPISLTTTPQVFVPLIQKLRWPFYYCFNSMSTQTGLWVSSILV